MTRERRVRDHDARFFSVQKKWFRNFLFATKYVSYTYARYA